MNKSQINRIAEQRQKAEAQPTAQDAPEQLQERAATQAVNLAPETIAALVGGFSRELRRALLELGPILARIAAADTIHTVERPPRVFAHALLEAQTATGILQEAGVRK